MTTKRPASNIRSAPVAPGRSRLARTGRAAESLRFIDLFAGTGGFRLAFESLGGRCVFSSEWDRFARETYRANFGEEPAGDLRGIVSKDMPAFDLLCAGFPCQPFSLAGVSKKNSLGRVHGFADATQGTLFFDIARIIKERRPSAFLLENVRNLLSHDGGKTFAVMQRVLSEELGYHIRHSLINAAAFVPQNRVRVYIVGFRSAAAAERFCFPQPTIADRAPILADVLEARVDPKYRLSDHLWKYLQKYREKHQKAGHGFGFGLTQRSGVARTLSARYYKDGSEILVAMPRGNPRRLTPRECARLMGYPDSFRIVVSDTQAYKQFGNAVAVPVVRAVGERIIEALRGGRNRQMNRILGQAGGRARSKAPVVGPRRDRRPA